MTLRDVLIAAFLAVQLLVPAAWYAMGPDANDSRFAWRMFAPETRTTCDARLTVAGSVAPWSDYVPEAWLHPMGEGRVPVIDAALERICAAHPEGGVHISISCRDTTREHLQRVGDPCR